MRGRCRARSAVEKAEVEVEAAVEMREGSKRRRKCGSAEKKEKNKIKEAEATLEEVCEGAKRGHLCGARRSCSAPCTMGGTLRCTLAM